MKSSSGETKPLWKVKLLGQLVVRRGEEILPIKSNIRHRALFGCLVLAALFPENSELPRRREDLAEAIWDEASPMGQRKLNGNSDPLKFLSGGLSRLREALEKPFKHGTLLLSEKPDRLSVNSLVIETDVGQFRAVLKEAENMQNALERQALLQQAVRIYEDGGGDLLAEISTECIQNLRQRLKADYLRTKNEIGRLERFEAHASLHARDEFLSQQNLLHQRELARQASAAQATPEERTWIDWVEAGREACQAALRREIAEDCEPTLLTDPIVRHVWIKYGHAREIRHWLVGLLKKSDAVAPTPRPWVLRVIGQLSATLAGEGEVALRYVRAALAGFRRMGRKHQIAGTLEYLSWLEAAQGLYDKAIVHAQEAQTVACELGEEERIANLTAAMAEHYILWAKRTLENAQATHDFWKAASAREEARNHYLAATECARKAIEDHECAGRAVRAGWAYLFLGLARAGLNDRKGTNIALGKSQAIARQHGDQRLEVNIEESRGYVALDRQEWTQAAGHFADALRIYLNKQDHDLWIALRLYLRASAHALEATTSASEFHENVLRLAELLGLHDSLEKQANLGCFPIIEEQKQFIARVLQAHLGEKIFSERRQKGDQAGLRAYLSILASL